MYISPVVSGFSSLHGSSFSGKKINYLRVGGSLAGWGGFIGSLYTLGNSRHFIYSKPFLFLHVPLLFYVWEFFLSLSLYISTLDS
jgi:hypothetical protein